MREKFNHELENVENIVLKMSKDIEKILQVILDDGLKQRILALQQVESLRLALEKQEQISQSLISKLMIQQQPVAKDFKFLSSHLKIVADMRRIGEVSYNIAQALEEISTHTKTDSLQEMAAINLDMFKKMLACYQNKDLAEVEAVVADERKMDILFDAFKDVVIKQLKSDSEDAHEWLELFMVAKYLERISDHIFLMAKWMQEYIK